MKKFLTGAILTAGAFGVGYVSGLTSCVLATTADTLEAEEMRESLKEITKLRAQEVTDKIRKTYQKGKDEAKKVADKIPNDIPNTINKSIKDLLAKYDINTQEDINKVLDNLQKSFAEVSKKLEDDINDECTCDSRGPHWSEVNHDRPDTDSDGSW